MVIRERKKKKKTCFVEQWECEYICTCVKERSVWVCGKWVRVTKSACVGGGWALSQRVVEGRYVWAGRVEKAALQLCMRMS